MLGPNGAGKSTLLGFCGAVTHPTSGTVHVLGEQLGRVELQALRRTIGHVNPRHPLRSPLPVRDIVLTGLTGTIELPLRWQPHAAGVGARRRPDRALGLGAKARCPVERAVAGRAGPGAHRAGADLRAAAAAARRAVHRPRHRGPRAAARDHRPAHRDAPGRRVRAGDPSPRGAAVRHHARAAARRRPGGGGRARRWRRSPREHVSEAFEHPIDVRHDDGRWGARAARRSRACRSAEGGSRRLLLLSPVCRAGAGRSASACIRQTCLF